MDKAIDWIRAEAIPLASVAAGAGFADLAPLRKIIGDARIVSLGEATHGTREFFQLKHRLLEFCVAELGFTVFGIEASFPESLAVNDFVLHGGGDPADALASLRFWTWDTDEVLALIEWMRAWNRTHDRKVKFYGFDMQTPTVAALELVDYLRRVAPELAAASEAPLTPLAADFSFERFGLASAAAQAAAHAAIERVLAAFARERAAWIEATSELDWQLARMHAIVLEQGARSYGEVPSFEGRDVSMAENVRSLLEIEGPHAKAVLWAHNGHIARTSDYFTTEQVPIPNMGSRLHRMFGRQQLIVGFAFNQGTFQAIAPKRGLVHHTVPPAPAGSFDTALAMAGVPAFLLDLRTAPAHGPVSDWLAAKPVTRRIGAVYSDERAEELMHAGDPRDDFDLLAFIETTTAARANAAGRRLVADDAPLPAAPINLELAGTGGVPDGWRAPQPWRKHAHAIALCKEPSPAGGRTVRVARSPRPWRWGDAWLEQAFSAQAWRGRRLRFSAAARAQAQGLGTGARLFAHVAAADAVGVRRAGNITAVSPAIDAPQWQAYTVEIDVPEDAEAIVIGFVVLGDSAGWFGDLRVETVARGGVVPHTCRELQTSP
jgi:erythromycin esterase